ncbi:hypothetical protein [Nonomuraea sp. NPDC050643]|uniref:hypothetical protein n=1 Tax=Nonomuraea sp. NPDC050643 TaxID=3155660 RepID=UPI0033C4C691
MSLSRRTFLAAAPVAAVAGCGGGPPPLRVAVVWSGDELRHFREVVKGFEDRFQRTVRVYSAGENVSALLRGPVEEVLPDVAVIPRLALLRDLDVRGRAAPLSVDAGPSAFWRELVSRPDGRVLASWFKIAHKSLVWHRAPRPGEAPYRPPENLEAWADAPGRLSIGAAEGWVLSSWFENVLLACHPTAYDTLFDSGGGAPGEWDTQPVKDALQRVARIWQNGLDSDAGRRALTKQFHDAVIDVFVRETADVVAAPDFAWPIIAAHGKRSAARHFRFPASAGKRAPLVVGGDMAVAIRSGAAVFVEWLTGLRARDGNDPLERWVRDGGFLTPLIPPDRSPEPLRGPAQELADEAGGRYGLSDRLIGGLEAGDGRGLFRILTELFIDAVINRHQPDQAADTARAKLAESVARDHRKSTS